LWGWLNVLAFALAVVPTLLLVLGELERNTTWGYAASEWLVNNRGGFTRRGLSGDVLLAMPWVSDQAALIATVTAVLVFVAVGFALLVALTIRRARAGWPLLFWLLPGGLALGTLQSTIHGRGLDGATLALRKEYLFLSVLLWVVLACARWPSSRAWLAIAGASAFACGLGVLVHEGLAVVTCAALMYVLFWLHPNPPQRTVRLARARSTDSPKSGLLLPTPLALAAPALVALGAVSSATLHSAVDFRVTWSAVDSATREWLSLPNVQVWGADAGFPAALWWLTTRPEHGINWLARDYLDSGLWLAWAVTAVLVVGWVLAAGWLLDTSRAARRKDLISVALASAALMPLFVLALDWGRWIALIGVISAILMLGRIALSPKHPRPSPFTPSTAALALLLISVGLAMHMPVAGGDFWLAHWLI
jgi:hypothetical protein